jgi:hypothetical protein
MIQRQRVLNFVRNKHPGFLFLHETYTTHSDEQTWKAVWKGKIMMSHGMNHSKGVAILIPDNIEFEAKCT